MVAEGVKNTENVVAMLAFWMAQILLPSQLTEQVISVELTRKKNTYELS